MMEILEEWAARCEDQFDDFLTILMGLHIEHDVGYGLLDECLEDTFDRIWLVIIWADATDWLFDVIDDVGWIGVFEDCLDVFEKIEFVGEDDSLEVSDCGAFIEMFEMGDFGVEAKDVDGFFWGGVWMREDMMTTDVCFRKVFGMI